MMPDYWEVLRNALNNVLHRNAVNLTPAISRELDSLKVDSPAKPAVRLAVYRAFGEGCHYVPGVRPNTKNRAAILLKIFLAQGWPWRDNATVTAPTRR